MKIQSWINLVFPLYAMDLHPEGENEVWPGDSGLIFFFKEIYWKINIQVSLVSLHKLDINSRDIVITQDIFEILWNSSEVGFISSLWKFFLPDLHFPFLPSLSPLLSFLPFLPWPNFWCLLRASPARHGEYLSLSWELPQFGRKSRLRSRSTTF